MDGLRVLERAAVAPSDLRLDPAAPFRVTAAPGLSPARQAQVKAALLRAGWGQCDEAARASAAAAVMATLDAAAWTHFFETTTDFRMEQEPDALKRWVDEPADQGRPGVAWGRWRTLLDDEAVRRLPVAPPVDVDKRASQRDRLLAVLRERGPAGVLNTELNEWVGFRYAARAKELRDEGYEIRTDQLAAQVFRYTLVSEPAPKQMTMGEAA